MTRRTEATIVAALVLGAGLLATGCKGGKGGGAAGKKSKQQPPAPVTVAPVKLGPIRVSLRYPGELAAPESVELASEVSGRLEEVRVRMGQEVKQGQLLVRVDDAQLRSQLQEARAALAVASSTLQRARVEQRTAATEMRRKSSLAKRDLITKQEMDNVRARNDTAAASLAVASAQVSQAQARVELLGKQVRDTRIRAPFSGWVQARRLDPGAVVSPGTAVLKLVRKSPIVVRFKVGERHIGEIRRRMAQGALPVQIRVDAYPRQPFVGTIVRVAPALDVASRTVAVEAELDNKDGRLMPGMFCRVSLDLGTRQRALLVPLQALVKGNGGEQSEDRSRSARVFVVREGRARLTQIQLGAEAPGKTDGDGGHGEVLSGLEAGQKVVVEGHEDLMDGARVEVVHDAPTPASQPAKTGSGK